MEKKKSLIGFSVEPHNIFTSPSVIIVLHSLLKHFDSPDITVLKQSSLTSNPAFVLHYTVDLWNNFD